MTCRYVAREKEVENSYLVSQLESILSIQAKKTRLCCEISAS